MNEPVPLDGVYSGGLSRCPAGCLTMLQLLQRSSRQDSGQRADRVRYGRQIQAVFMWCGERKGRERKLGFGPGAGWRPVAGWLEAVGGWWEGGQVYGSRRRKREVSEW